MASRSRRLNNWARPELRVSVRGESVSLCEIHSQRNCYVGGRRGSFRDLILGLAAVGCYLTTRCAPTITDSGATSRSTTELAPITECFPIVICVFLGGAMTAPAAIFTPS